MPELPEVQTVVNDLNNSVINRKIIRVWCDSPKTIKNLKVKNLIEKIKGLKIKEVTRRGKNILISLSNNYLLLIHLKMTGHLLLGKWQIKKISGSKFQVISLIKGPLQERVNDFIHVIFYFSDGWQLALSDLRKFAKILFGSKEEIEKIPDLSRLGPEVITVINLKEKKFKFLKAEEFKSLIKNEKRKIKQVLLDQEIITGIGNIYADEILWKAKISPLKSVYLLSDKHLIKVYLATKEILKKAIEFRGTSISDFRDLSGLPGVYARVLRVYRREGKPCFRCGEKIKRIKIASRSSYFCPKCQS